ncbi:DNA polymerase III subunit gamma/tau [Chiayiivirga flava]|uniref:DNA polymerase III subunit gamma/tau n=1 Tax=Chiayiivirga flava TaxID=659595 RepID=A0A7W8G0V7_9GAMM|nr:DNA polymerase III subunit gamma/tau [Chiayiivirga flava]MBB5207035.1 DNA polymerase-3 subunit gamma/tau [Chiayiivirga flava]
MSYLVLARKWRPRRFAELVGQEHVVRALSNALESGKVHHAFLFTGTRGVGKTTIARIFAKSLNCEKGVGAEPCGVCEVCTAVDQGRFVDLLEIDAASNTGVDDVREVIDNAQYMPTRGRYKVYLIDEVHMLSKNAFNALLKTLEEPPEHVKFLLATTDPQKLPVTVLSRCLQFNLKRLTEAQIAGQMDAILAAEGVTHDTGSIALLARGADGSLRDGLSLLDQALAFGNGALVEDDVRTMLGTVDRTQVGALLAALSAGDGPGLMEVAERIAGFAPDFGSALDELAQALHRVQLLQLVPGIEIGDDRIDLPGIASTVSPELIQLWYQMALHGRRDLSLAPSLRVGFDMTLLRMLAFRPAQGGSARVAAPQREPVAATVRDAPTRAAAVDAARAALGDGPYRSAAPPTPHRIADTTASTPAVEPAVPRAAGDAPAPVRSIHEAAPPRSPAMPLRNNDDWLDALRATSLRGPARTVIDHATFIAYVDNTLRLHLPPAQDIFRNPALDAQIAAALGDVLGTPPRLEFTTAAPRGAAGAETLHHRTARERDQRQVEAEAAFANDPTVQRLMQNGARIVPDSVRPLDER